MRRRSTAASLLTAVLLATTGACSDDRPERAITVEPEDNGTPSSSTGSGSDEETEAVAPDAGAAEPLTEKQINDALLRVQDMPTGWSKQKNEPDDESEATIKPARCQEVLETLDGPEAEPVVKGEATFNNGGPFGTTFVHSISSYEDEIDPDVAQKIADAFGSCPEFTPTDAEGTESTFTVSPMSFANLGDQTLAFAMTASSEGFEFTFNIAMVTVGHNAATFMTAGIAGVSGGELETLARTGMERLDSATRS